MVSQIALAVHITTGAAALALGPASLVAAGRRGPANRAGAAYHWAVLCVCVSAIVLAVLDWEHLWWFLPIAAGSYALALLGRVAAGRPGERWTRLYVHGQGGSYIALVTALLVVSAGSPAAWVAPTIVGLPLIAVALRRLGAAPATRRTRSRPARRPPGPRDPRARARSRGPRAST